MKENVGANKRGEIQICGAKYTGNAKKSPGAVVCLLLWRAVKLVVCAESIYLLLHIFFTFLKLEYINKR